jgi:hypothetical protein
MRRSSTSRSDGRRGNGEEAVGGLFHRFFVAGFFAAGPFDAAGFFGAAAFFGAAVALPSRSSFSASARVMID